LTILHLSTYQTKCGIGDYLRYLLDGFEQLDEKIENHVFSIVTFTTKKFNYNEAKDFYEKFIEKAESYDIIHIQHEFGTFTGDYPIWKSFKLLTIY
jgi:hypothetical protein